MKVLENTKEVRHVQVVEQAETIDDVKLAVSVPVTSRTSFCRNFTLSSPCRAAQAAPTSMRWGAGVQRRTSAPAGRPRSQDALAAAQVEDSQLPKRPRARSRVTCMIRLTLTPLASPACGTGREPSLPCGRRARARRRRAAGRIPPRRYYRARRLGGDRAGDARRQCEHRRTSSGTGRPAREW